MLNEVKPLELHWWAFVVYAANFSIDRSKMRQIFFFPIGEKKMKKNLLLLMVLAIVFAFAAVSCNSEGAEGEYIVSFYREPGEAAVATKVVKNGGFVAEPTPAPVKVCSSFMGWYYKGAKFDFENTPITGDIDLYAKWGDASSGEEPGESGFTVTFDLNGGTSINMKTTVRVKENGRVSEPTDTIIPPDRAVWFKEWRLDGKKYDFNTPVTGDIRLTAAYWMKMEMKDSNMLKAEVPMFLSFSAEKESRKMSPSDDVSTFFSADDLLLIGLAVKGGFTEFGFDVLPYIEIEGERYYFEMTGFNAPSGIVGTITGYRIDNASLGDYKIDVTEEAKKFVLSYTNLSFKLTITETTKTGETPVARNLPYDVNLSLDSNYDTIETGKISVDYVVDGKEQPSFRMQEQMMGYTIDFGDYRCMLSSEV